MVDLGVLKEKSGARITDTLVRVMVEPRVKDVEVPTVLLDSTPACWLAPLAAPGPANAEAADGYPLSIPYVEGHQRPVGVYFRAGLVGVDPFEGIPTTGVDRPRELVGAVLDGEGRGGRAVRCHPGKVLAGGENRVACRGSGGNRCPYADRHRNCQDKPKFLQGPPPPNVAVSSLLSMPHERCPRIDP